MEIRYEIGNKKLYQLVTKAKIEPVVSGAACHSMIMVGIIDLTMDNNKEGCIDSDACFIVSRLGNGC